MKRFLFGTVAAIVTAVSANAADLPDYEAPAAPVVAPYDWTGFYLGLQAGYGWSQADTTFTGPAPPPIGISPDGDGFVGGAHAGYLQQFDSFVLGVEADIEYSDINGFDRSLAPSGSGKADIDWMGSLRLRAGYAWDRALLYATGGLAYASVDGSGGPAAGPLQGFSDDVWGWTLGAGVDYAFTDTVSIRAEYRYTDFDDASSNLGPLYPTVNASTDIDVHALRLGVSYHF